MTTGTPIIGALLYGREMIQVYVSEWSEVKVEKQGGWNLISGFTFSPFSCPFSNDCKHTRSDWSLGSIYVQVQIPLHELLDGTRLQNKRLFFPCTPITVINQGVRALRILAW